MARRKIKLINKSFQYKFIARFIILNTIIMLIFAGFIYIFMSSEIDASRLKAQVTYNNMRDMLLPIVVTLSIINLIVSSIVIWGFVLIVSHRLAGPMYRFNQALDNMSDKNFKPYTDLRDGDQFGELSDSVQNLALTISKDLKGLKSKISDIKSLIETGKNKEKIAKNLKELEDIIKQYDY